MKPTLEQKMYALRVLQICMAQAADSCGDCDGTEIGDCDICSVDGGDLVDAVTDMILSLEEDLTPGINE